MSEDKKKRATEMVRDYSMKYYGELLEQYEIMCRHLPETMASWIDLRKAVFQDPPEGGLTLREKELICTAIEIAHCIPSADHARYAVRAGATPKDLAAVAAICILLVGMTTFIKEGFNAVKAAEEEYDKLMKEKKK